MGFDAVIPSTYDEPGFRLHGLRLTRIISQVAAEAALQKTGGNVEQAMEMLLASM